MHRHCPHAQEVSRGTKKLYETMSSHQKCKGNHQIASFNQPAGFSGYQREPTLTSLKRLIRSSSCNVQQPNLFYMLGPKNHSPPIQGRRKEQAASSAAQNHRDSLNFLFNHYHILHFQQMGSSMRKWKIYVLSRLTTVAVAL